MPGDRALYSRLLNQREGCNKFYEVRLAVNDVAVSGAWYVTVRWGRVGTDGRVQTKASGSYDTCLREFNKLVRSKQQRGYDVVDTESGKPAKTITEVVRESFQARQSESVVNQLTALGQRKLQR